jgi:hypothetical protein
MEEVTDTKPEALADKWQKTIDKDFPDGLLMAWKDSDSESSPLYRIWKITVVGMEGFDPVVELKVFDVAKKFVGRLTSYKKTQDKPLMAEVKFENIDSSMVWSANISPQLAELMKSGPQGL